MTLENLLKVMSDEQEVRLRGDDFDEVSGFKSTLESVLSDAVLERSVDCVAAALEGVLKVWVKNDDQ